MDERREHEHLQLALEAAQLGTWYWDEQTGLTVWDARLEAMHGMAPGSFGGTFADWEASLYPADRAACVAKVAAAMADPGPYVLLHRTQWPDGSIHWLEGRGRVITDDEGHALGTIGVVARRHRPRGTSGCARPPHRRGPPADPERAARAAPGAHAPGRRHRVRGALRSRAGFGDRRRLVRVRAVARRSSRCRDRRRRGTRAGGGRRDGARPVQPAFAVVPARRSHRGARAAQRAGARLLTRHDGHGALRHARPALGVLRVRDRRASPAHAVRARRV